MVIPAMDYIDETFTNGVLDSKSLSPAIRAALKLAKMTLNRYYSLTDSSDVYRIAIGTYSCPNTRALDNVAQFYTLDTNSSTSRPLIGPRIGLQRQGSS